MRKIVIVRTCKTSQGLVTVEVPGGTKDSEPMEFSDFEAENLLASCHARDPRPDELDPKPAPPPAAASEEV